jgi:general secretion pathway protein N
VIGRTTLEMTRHGLALSSIRPLGSYALALDWRGQQARLTLSSVKGPLLLSGRGSLNNGRLRFSGQAERPGIGRGAGQSAEFAGPAQAG